MDKATLKEAYSRGLTYDQFLNEASNRQGIWLMQTRNAVVDPELLTRASQLPGRLHLLVLAEDWCGDASNTLPVLALLANSLNNIELRVLKRDEEPELTQAHLTEGKKSIPVVMLLDEDFEEVAWWGPRPAELQAFFIHHRDDYSKIEMYRKLRQWYALDRGQSAIREILDMATSHTPVA